MALTATSTIGSWLDDPRGAPIMEELLTGVELPDGALEQVKALPLQQLVALSQGKLLQSAVDDMVRAVNDGTIPEESPAAPPTHDSRAGPWSSPAPQRASAPPSPPAWPAKAVA